MENDGDPDRGTAALAQQSRIGLFVWGLIGFMIGSALRSDVFGGVTGGAIGVLWGAWRRASRQNAELAGALQRLEARVRAVEADPMPAVRAAEEIGIAATAAVVAAESDDTAAAEPALSLPASSPPPRMARPNEPGVFERAAASLRDVLFGGNTVVRVGVLVLLVGLTVLARWAVENHLFPVEARLATASLIGMALIVVGYRLREARPGFATTLQGGGIAALYLVVFFALRIFDLVPVGMAFALFVAIAVACGLLAVAQRSQALIFIGSLGGFLAPILASTGGGNHVALFSYYLVLNIAIAAVAWRESWRALNLLAFVATYGIATIWGVLRYRPADFATTEPFLLLYMVLFTAIAVLFATRQTPRLAGLVDGTLVFGTPLVTLLAQARLVEGRDFGMAYSTAGFAIFYAAVATWVWRHSPETLRRMAEAFLALAVGFATAAIPLGLDDALMTTLVWAAEGAGIYWVGARQNRRLARYAGIGLQGLAAAAFFWSTEVSGDRIAVTWAFANARFLACLAMALAGFFIAREAYAAREQSTRDEWELTQVLAAWGLLWWARAFLGEIDQFLDDYQATAVVVWIGASAVALERVARRADWLPGRLLALSAIPAATVAIAFSFDVQDHLLANGGWWAWPFALAALYIVLHSVEDCAVPRVVTAYAPMLWLLAAVSTLALHGFTRHVLHLSVDWQLAAVAVGFTALLLGTCRAIRDEIGPWGRHPAVHAELGLGPIAAAALLWTAAINTTARGAAAPLPYIPLLNPADVALGLIAIGFATWWILLQRMRPSSIHEDLQPYVAPAIAGLLFLWLNGLLVRTVHQWGDVAFTARALWRSASLQVSVSIAWTLVALGGMVLSTRSAWRSRWLAFAGLLGVVVVKLFAVDLSQLRTGAKIGTFLVVGVLLLVIGYLSPVPPEIDGADRGDDAAAGATEGEA